MLIAKAHSLDAIFNALLRRASANAESGYTQAAETYMRLGLKAQAQCRATIEALVNMKNPRPVAYVQQTNIAQGPQQVNNGPQPAQTSFINSQGELGVTGSSERFKTAIAPMGSNSAKLGQLRPVTFKLKSDAMGTRQYGLIAEEVAKVYPELVVRDEKGRIEGVRYDELGPMLLNEVQKQAAEIRALKRQQKQFIAQAEQLRGVQQQLAALHAELAKLQSKDGFVAQR